MHAGLHSHLFISTMGGRHLAVDVTVTTFLHNEDKNEPETDYANEGSVLGLDKRVWKAIDRIEDKEHPPKPPSPRVIAKRIRGPNTNVPDLPRPPSVVSSSTTSETSLSSWGTSSGGNKQQDVIGRTDSTRSLIGCESSGSSQGVVQVSSRQISRESCTCHQADAVFRSSSRPLPTSHLGGNDDVEKSSSRCSSSLFHRDPSEQSVSAPSVSSSVPFLPFPSTPDPSPSSATQDQSLPPDSPSLALNGFTRSSCWRTLGVCAVMVLIYRLLLPEHHCAYHPMS